MFISRTGAGKCLGELNQIDRSEHRWYEDRGPACTLLVFIDDAAGRLMQMRVVASESKQTCFAPKVNRPGFTGGFAVH